jgi:hypothetical protein
MEAITNLIGDFMKNVYELFTNTDDDIFYVPNNFLNTDIDVDEAEVNELIETVKQEIVFDKEYNILKDRLQELMREDTIDEEDEGDGEEEDNDDSNNNNGAVPVAIL